LGFLTLIKYLAFSFWLEDSLSLLFIIKIVFLSIISSKLKA